MAILRLVHIFSGVLWAGWAFSLSAFVEPASRAAGPEGGKFMQSLAGKTRVIPTMAIAPPLASLSGLLIYWRSSGGLDGNWIASGPGLALTLGSLAGILAFVLGLAYNRPIAQRLAELSRQLQTAGGPPSPTQMAALQGHQTRLRKAGLLVAVLLAVTVVTMSVARYL